uniref:Uncharacterized protein n=1 Tax=Tanacetum cinerariifolium TaxID=118510 RepID=A0A699JU93_TANCI|nr:hypothetical protein [Tanacetum cinerariifolium]
MFLRLFSNTSPTFVTRMEAAIYYRRKEMAFKNFIIKGIDSEFNFLSNELTDDIRAGSLSISVNNETQLLS